MLTPKKICQGRKRKRENSESSTDDNEFSDLPVNSLLVEKNITALAAKNNLDDQSVKKILKKVVTNDHVLALVKLREEEEEEVEEKVSVLGKNTPKLTRAKVKELKKVSSKIAPPWNLENLELTPIKHIPVKTRPEVKALIAQELPDDEDDEEYEPTQEDVISDDDQTLESCSDLDSEPRTPATPVPYLPASPQVVKDGPFKVPLDVSTTPVRRKLVIESDEATIARRTRSKLCLSETPIEHIESSFVPPDELPPVKDNLWEEFLQECLDPAPPNKHEDDDEADPEYNVAADPHANDEEEEALECTNIEISEKELNDLVTELFNVMPDVASDEQLLQTLPNNVLTTSGNAEAVPVNEEPVRTKENDQPNLNATQKETDSTNDSNKAVITTEGLIERVPLKTTQCRVSVVHRIEERPQSFIPSPPPAPPALLSALAPNATQPVRVPLSKEPLVLPQQVLILQQQFRQHVQLIASNFLQTCVHPQSWTVAPTYKEFLENLVNQARKDPESVVNVCNLQPAWELVNSWEDSVSKDTPENKEMVQFIQKEIDRSRRRACQNSMYVGNFHPTLMDTVANSTVFLYPHLLPPLPYRYDGIRRYSYSRAEDELIALGMDMYWKHIEDNPRLYKPPRRKSALNRWGLTAAAELVAKHLMTTMPLKSLLGHIYHVRRTDDPDNPIVKFFKTREVTPYKHELYPYNPDMTLYDQPEAEMPQIWLRHVAKTSKRFRKHLVSAKRMSFSRKPPGIPVDMGTIVEEPKKIPIRNTYFRDFPKVQVGSPATADTVVPTTQTEDDNDVLSKAKIFTFVDTSEGPVLVPLKLVRPNTTNANETTGENETIKDPVPIQSDSNHCTCCVLLRNIRENCPENCPCDMNLPTQSVSNKLKALISLYKTKKMFYMSNIKAYLDSEDKKDIAVDEWDNEDLVYATSYQSKLSMWVDACKERFMSEKIKKAFLNFDHNCGDPIKLAETLDKAFGAKLIELHKEFIGFLTPEQADKIGRFKDYFVNNCLSVLLKKINELVADDGSRKSICKSLVELVGQSQSSCEFCTSLMNQTSAHPQLAAFIFDMFPHTSIRGIRCSDATKSAVTDTSISTYTDVSKDADVRANLVADAVKCVKTEPKGDCDTNVDTDSDVKHDRDTYTDTDREYDIDEDSDAEVKFKIEPEELTDTTDAFDDTEDMDANMGVKTEPVIDADKEIVDKLDAMNDCIKACNGKLYIDGDKLNETQTESKRAINTNETTVDESAIDDDSGSDASMVIAEHVKNEPTEWKREEDKIILEMLKEFLTLEKHENKTTMEMIEETSIIANISESLLEKSISDIKERILCLLQILVVDS